MSAATVVERYLQDAESKAATTGRREFKVAAQRLAMLVAHLQKNAARERSKKRRQRAQLSLGGCA